MDSHLRLTTALSTSLNRDVGSGMVDTVLRLYSRDNTREGFGRLISVLGVREDDVDEIYRLVGELKREDKENGEIDPIGQGINQGQEGGKEEVDRQYFRNDQTHRDVQDAQTQDTKGGHNHKDAQDSQTHRDENIQDTKEDTKVHDQGTQDQGTPDQVTLDQSTQNQGAQNQVTQPPDVIDKVVSKDRLQEPRDPSQTALIPVKPKKVIAFKKIKKEDAERIKRGQSEVKKEGDTVKEQKDREVSKGLQDGSKREDRQYDLLQKVSKGDHIHHLLKEVSNRQNDLQEGHGDPNTLTDSFTSKDLTDFNGRPLHITSHMLVPPFLEASQHLLAILLEKVGPTVNPVKDPGSELALAAKRGSGVVQERRSARERARLVRGALGEKQEERKEENDRKEDRKVDRKEDRKVDRKEDRKVDRKEEKEGKDRKQENLDTFKAISKLPAYACRDALVRTVLENQITIVIGETGSGKTTQIPQFLRAEGVGKLACTQPRRVAATSVAKRVAEEVGCRLGDIVGYLIRFEDMTSSATEIKYMTEGILLREMLADPQLSAYGCVVMDEAHERTLNTDILLGLLKALVRRRADLRVVITSATMNAERFARFFGDAPLFTIPGRSFPVDVMYSRHVEMDYVESAVKQALTVHLTQPPGDILVFMTGQEDIEAVCDMLSEKLEMLEAAPALDVVPIYSALPEDQQRRIFAHSSARKIIVATNIAETSLTVDGVRYVIDSGLVKIKVYNPRLAMDALQVVPVAAANAQQRAGRAGRTASGVAYRLYTEHALIDTYAQPVPEIQRANLASVVLLLKTLNVGDVSQFAFLDPPPRDTLACALYDLWAMGALDHAGSLTSLGRALARFPMDPVLAKALVMSARHEFACSSEMATLVAMLLVPPVFVRPRERAAQADAARERFAVANLDHLTLVNVYTQWEQAGRKGAITAWCSRNFVLPRLLAKAREVRRQLVDLMVAAQMPVERGSDEDMRRCLAASFYQNAARLSKVNVHGSGEYTSLRHSYMTMNLHPTLVVDGIDAKYVVYHELVLTSREYILCVTSVDPAWLVRYGAVFYDARGAERAPWYRGVAGIRAEMEAVKEREMEVKGKEKVKEKVKKRRRF